MDATDEELTTDEGSRRERADALRDLGVAENVCGFVEAQSYPRPWRSRYLAYRAASLVFILITPIGMGALAFAWIRSLEAGRTEIGYFSAENHGWSILLASLGWLFTAAWVAATMPALLGRRAAAYVASRSLVSNTRASGRGWLGAALSRRIYRGAVSRSSGKDPEQVLLSMHRALIFSLLWPAALLMTLSLMAVAVDFGTYAVGTTAGVERHGVFGSSSLPWDALRAVHFGCAVREDGHPYTVYELAFADGDTVTALLHPTPRALEKMAALDVELRRRKVPISVATYTAGRYSGQSVWTDDCVEQLSASTGSAPEMVARIFSPSED